MSSDGSPRIPSVKGSRAAVPRHGSHHSEPLRADRSSSSTVTAESDLKDASCERVQGWTARVGAAAGRARRRHDTVKCIRGIHPPPSDRRADDAGYYY